MIKFSIWTTRGNGAVGSGNSSGNRIDSGYLGICLILTFLVDGDAVGSRKKSLDPFGFLSVEQVFVHVTFV